MILTQCYEFHCPIISLPGCRKQFTKWFTGKHWSTLSPTSNDHCLLMTTTYWKHKAHALRFLSFSVLQERPISNASLCPSKVRLSCALLIGRSQMATISSCSACGGHSHPQHLLPQLPKRKGNVVNWAPFPRSETRLWLTFHCQSKPHGGPHLPSKR